MVAVTKENCRKKLLLVLGLALVCRIVYAFLVWTPLFKNGDSGLAQAYIDSAYLLAAGAGYHKVLPGDSPALRDIIKVEEKISQGIIITPATAGPISKDGLYPEMLHPPGWAILAFVLYRLSGLPVWLVMQIAGIVVDTAACGLLFWLVFLCLGRSRIATTAAIIYAIFPPVCYSAVYLEPRGFMFFFLILGTIFIVLAARSTTWRKWVHYGMCGVSIGIGSYFRPDFLLLGPFFFIGLWFYLRRFWFSLLAGTAVLAISLLVLFPWAYRNYQICGRWIFTSSAVGSTLISGLGAHPNPWGFGPSDNDRAIDAAKHGISNPLGPVADAYFRKVFVESVKERPWAYAKIIAQRTPHIIATPYTCGFKRTGKIAYSELQSQGKIFSNIGYMVKTFWDRILMAIISFVSLVCTIEMFLCERTRYKLIIFPILVPVYSALSHLFTIMEPEYLLPGVFGQLIGLAYVMSHGWRDDAAPSIENKLNALEA